MLCQQMDSRGCGTEETPIRIVMFKKRRSQSVLCMVTPKNCWLIRVAVGDVSKKQPDK